MKGRERVGSYCAGVKIKCIFSIALVGNLENSRECSSQRNTHRTVAIEAPELRLSVRCAVVLGLSTGR